MQWFYYCDFKAMEEPNQPLFPCMYIYTMYMIWSYMLSKKIAPKWNTYLSCFNDVYKKGNGQRAFPNDGYRSW